MDVVKVFGPATVANVGPGFDILGLAVSGLGDTVIAKKVDRPGVFIETISGDQGRLPLDPESNTAGVAALHTLDIVKAKGGVSLQLVKGLPLGSGLGSSAASAAAAAWAVAQLYEFQDKEALLPACLAAEAAVSGYHADNVAPSLLGGLILIKGYDPLQIESLPTPTNLHLVLVTPAHEVPTLEARNAIPKMIPLSTVVANSGNLSGLLTATFRNDVVAFGQSIVDEIVEPARAHLIPGFSEVKAAALAAGGYGCSISGAGPTIFAIAESAESGRKIGAAMHQAFKAAGLSSKVQVSTVDSRGARQI